MKPETREKIYLTIIGVMLLGIVGYYVAQNAETNSKQWDFLTRHNVQNKDLIKDNDKRIVRLETINEVTKYFRDKK